MKQHKKIYLTNQQLADALIESQNLGQPTEKVCNYFKMIATHLLRSPKYKNYPLSLQQEMVSAALLKCVKNIHNFKEEYADSCFNYYTRATECAFFEVLGEYYKQKNLIRELTLGYASALYSIDPKAANTIIRSQMEIGNE